MPHSARVSLKYCKRLGRPVHGVGTLSQWTRKGGRFELKYRLEIGDWIVLEPEASRASSIREFHTVFPERRPLMARVVSRDESTSPKLHTSYTYGVQFVFDRRTLFSSYLYALAPWFALVMFIAGIVTVAVWKTSNVYFL